jgi:hypothetical protein
MSNEATNMPKASVLTEERWFDFRYQYIETGRFDYDRHKTIEAMRKLAERIPDDVLDGLDNRTPLVVFAPSAAKLGELKPFGLGDRMFLYLSPRLEKLPQREVDFTVAHEFAHVALGHYKPGATAHPAGAVIERHEDAPTEQDADRLAESWGFPRPKRAKRKRGRP